MSASAARADDKMAATTSSVDELFLFYRQKFSRTCFAMLLTVQIIYHVVYIVLRRTLASQVRFIMSSQIL